jgi:hypothetical protein
MEKFPAHDFGCCAVDDLALKLFLWLSLFVYIYIYWLYYINLSFDWATDEIR